MTLLNKIEPFLSAKLTNLFPTLRKRAKEHLFYRQKMKFEPGHYYSPVPTLEEINENYPDFWQKHPQLELTGIDLSPEKQIELFNKIKSNYNDLDIPSDEHESNSRYYFNNGFYSYTDGIVLALMMLHFKPKRIIEIGSGFSSALMLDINEKYLNGLTELTFIEPYPSRLKDLLKAEESVNIIEKNIQLTDVKKFESLSKNDILFIDSSHVCKTGSDVLHIYFNILPKLQSGVLIHVHDIFYPFEYPKMWIEQGITWNETYLLRALLTNNQSFEILFFADYMHKFHPEIFAETPLAFKSTGGNIWLRKK